MNLINIFGSEIKVSWQPRTPDRQCNRYPGGDGMTTIYLGTGGYPIVVTGTLRAPGANYKIARTAMVAKVKAIEAMAWWPAQAFQYGNEVYEQVVLKRLLLLPIDGKTFHWTGQHCLCRFICTLRALV